jgi:hypothetical protein
LEVLGTMRLQTKGSPDATDRRLAQTASRCQSTARPVGGSLGSLLQGQAKHLFDLIVANLARGSRTGLVTQASDAFGNDATAPGGQLVEIAKLFRRVPVTNFKDPQLSDV